MSAPIDTAPAAAMGRIHLFSREPKIKILHLSWLAFLISFIVWFNLPPLMASIRDTFGLSKQQVAALAIMNVAFTIPARIGVGILVDKLGPRLMYSLLLLISGLLCIAFALSTSFEMLAVTRFLLAFAGAGFVVGIRIVAEWFPAKETGRAQGIYAGLGNFGSAVAAITLPTLAYSMTPYFPGWEGWRLAMIVTGIIAIIYGLIYYITVTDTPKGATYFKPKKMGAMEVTSTGDFLLYCVMQAPVVLSLALFAWRLGPGELKIISQPFEYTLYAITAGLFVFQVFDAFRVNKNIFREPVAQIYRYRFTQVAILDVAYLITFGSELTVVSILPLLFKDTFDLSLTMAGFLGASFGLTTFFARPAGGWLSDMYGRRRILILCLAGTAFGYTAMSYIGTATGIAYAVASTFVCSLFVNAGNGAVYAMLPMIKRRLTGQIAGMVGAFGNIGGVLFLVIYSAVDVHTFFLVAAAFAAAGVLLALAFVREPSGQIAEDMPDGSIAMIDVT